MRCLWLVVVVASAQLGVSYMPVRSSAFFLNLPIRSSSSPSLGTSQQPRYRGFSDVWTRSLCATTAAPGDAGKGGKGDGTGDVGKSLAAREKVAGAIPKAKSSGTDPHMMTLPPHSMFPQPPPESGDLDFDQAIHSGGLAFLKLYHEAKRPVIAHYWYKNCAMCKIMKPVIQRVVNEYADQIHYVDVEISLNKKTMKHAGVRSIPAVQVFRNGKMVSHFSGLQTVSGMRQQFEAATQDAHAKAAVELGSLLSGWRSNLQPASAREERQLAFPSRQTSTTASNNTSAARR